MKRFFHTIFGLIIGSAITAIAFFLFSNIHTRNDLMSFQTNIVRVTEENTDFRRVLFTGARSQLVVMSIPPGGEVGQEMHEDVEQIFYFQSGTGEATLDGKITSIVPGDVLVVTPGTEHNIRNTGTVPLQITTTYAPPNHIDGRVHRTKADADADVEDEAFGQAQ